MSSPRARFAHLPVQLVLLLPLATLGACDLFDQDLYLNADASTGGLTLREACGVGSPMVAGNMTYMVDTTGEHWGQIVRWEFGTIIAYNEGNGAIFHELELVALTGRVALGKDPIISTSYSVDGQSWSQDRPIRVGTTGNTTKRLAWFQQGHMRNWRIQRFRGDTQAHLSFARLEAQIEGLAY